MEENWVQKTYISPAKPSPHPPFKRCTEGAALHLAMRVGVRTAHHGSFVLKDLQREKGKKMPPCLQPPAPKSKYGRWSSTSVTELVLNSYISIRYFSYVVQLFCLQLRLLSVHHFSSNSVMLCHPKSPAPLSNLALSPRLLSNS